MNVSGVRGPMGVPSAKPMHVENAEPAERELAKAIVYSQRHGRAGPVQVGATPAYWSNPGQATFFFLHGANPEIDRQKWDTRAGYASACG